MANKQSVLNELQDALAGSTATSLPSDLHGFIGGLSAGAARIAFEGLAQDEIRRILPRRLKWAAPFVVAIAGASGVYGMDINQIGNFFNSRGGNMANQNQNQNQNQQTAPANPPTPAGIDTSVLTPGVRRTLEIMLKAFNADMMWDTMDSPFEVVRNAHLSYGSTREAGFLKASTLTEFREMRGHIKFLRDLKDQMTTENSAAEARSVYRDNFEQLTKSRSALEAFVEYKCVLYWDAVAMKADQDQPGLGSELVNQLKEVKSRLFSSADNITDVYQRILLYKQAQEAVNTTYTTMTSTLLLIPILLTSAVMIAFMTSAMVAAKWPLWWLSLSSLVAVSAIPFGVVYTNTESKAAGLLLAPLGAVATVTLFVQVGDLDTYSRILTMIGTNLAFCGVSWALIMALPHTAKELAELALSAFKSFIPGRQEDIKAWVNRIDGWDMGIVRKVANAAVAVVLIISAVVMVKPIWTLIT